MSLCSSSLSAGTTSLLFGISSRRLPRSAFALSNEVELQAYPRSAGWFLILLISDCLILTARIGTSRSKADRSSVFISGREGGLRLRRDDGPGPAVDEDMATSERDIGEVCLVCRSLVILVSLASMYSESQCRRSGAS